MKKILSVLGLMLLMSPVFAQNNVKQEAQKMGAALLKKDYDGFARFTYPDIVKQMGGERKMSASIKEQMEMMEKQGNHITALKFGSPSQIVNEGRELQCTIPQTMEIKIRNGKISTTSTLIAISTDNGTHWYFVDAGDRDINLVRTTMPNVSKKLVLPKPAGPKFIKG